MMKEFFLSKEAAYLPEHAVHPVVLQAATL